MFVPIWFLLAWLSWTLVEFWAEPALPQHANHALPALCLAVALFLLYHGSLTVAQTVSQRLQGRPGTVLRLSFVLRPALPLIFYIGVLVQGRWDAFVRFELAGSDLLPYSLLCIAPYLLFEALAILGEVLLTGRGGGSLDRVRATWLIAPVLFLILGWSALLTWHPLTRAAMQEIALARYVAWAAGFVAAFLLLPVWLSVLFRTQRVDPWLGEELGAVARRAGVRVAGIDLVDTGRRHLNAAVVGIAGWTRRVLMTDVLLARFSPQQIRAVFGHEIAHVVRHHGMRQVVFFLLLPLAVTAVVASWLPWRSDEVWLGVFVASMLVLGPVFRWLRHRFEHEADLYGSDLLGGAEPIVAALEAVDRAYPGRAHESSWMHPSTRDRIRFVDRATADAGFRREWSRRTRRVQAGLAIAFVLACALMVPSVVRGARASWPSFLLAAGWPERAYDAWLAADDVPDGHARDLDQVSRALRISYDLEPGPASVTDLRLRALRRAEIALQRERWAAALGWLGLARRLGDCGEAIDAMHAYLAAEAEHDRAAMEHAKRLLRSLPLPEELRKAVPRLPA